MSDENGILTVEERMDRIAEIERYVFHEMGESMKRLLELRQDRISGNIVACLRLSAEPAESGRRFVPRSGSRGHVSVE